NATNILAQKYFRGTLGTPERETSLKQVVDRIVDTILAWGQTDGYFTDEEEAAAFSDELKFLLIHQKAAFNSPVWFNIGVKDVPQQGSACFILSVDDQMRSILNWYTEEGIIFKGGSGAGVNISKIRSSRELLQGGGTASGPVSFMRGADASAGTIKSGGKTRRAAKMVILDVDHPDIQDFIWCKTVEERKARVLRDNGFDMDLDGKDSHSIQYQNANNSVRVTDEFMQAVVDDADWHLRAVTDGSIIETIKARDLFRQISQAAWECADPGMQFDTTINKWHTAATTGRINGSNPCCFTGETLVETVDGPVEFERLHKLDEAGLTLPEAVSFDVAGRVVTLGQINKAWIAGHTDSLINVRTAAGVVGRCTPEHRFLMADGRWVEAQHLVVGDRLRAAAGSAAIEDTVEAVDVEILDEPVAVYDLEVDGTHNFGIAGPASSVIVHNSEYMHLDNSACNLASLNLLTFLDEQDDDRFDVEGFKAATAVVFTAQEIIVGNGDYPTAKIAKTTRRFRQLGIGYANLGALLMAQGLAYDSDAGRAWAGAITALLTGHSYATSARTAARMGPFAGYQENRVHMLKVLGMHRDAVNEINEELVPVELLDAARSAWDEACTLGEVHGVRNSQASVTAPTGTIGLLMDCDTTGIEPDLGLVKMKKLVGGGTMSIVNQTVPRALRKLGYSDEQIGEIQAYIADQKSILGAPHLSPSHYDVFACSMGDNTIHYTGHIRMMAAAQPFLSGAISKCVTGDTLLATEDGLVRIESLHDDEAPDTFRGHFMQVASLDGVQKTDAFYFGGDREVREVVLRNGLRVTGTMNHRVMVAGVNGLDWRRLDEIEATDAVAVQYGSEMWSPVPSRFDGFAPSPSYGSQKAVRAPGEMTTELAFLLGAYASEGHTTRTNWTVHITNMCDAVLERVAAAWRSEFGVEAKILRPADRCPSVMVASKTIVEFLEFLGCGARASTKRIPDAVLRSPREMVLAFLQGLALDAYVTVAAAPKWGICLDAPKLLDDLQAVLANLGVVTGRVSKYNPVYDKSFDEVYAAGTQGQSVAALVPFMEPEKAERADALLRRVFEAAHATADVVPGIAPKDLFDLLPASARKGFHFLCDARTVQVTRLSLERVAAVPGVVLPYWLQAVLADGLHFSPVSRVVDAGVRPVYDISVPETMAFVGNGIVNHNTVNMPEDVSVEDVEELHIESWRLGLKAVAIYRDSCKVAQPLATAKKGHGREGFGDDPALAGTVDGAPTDAALAKKVAELEKEIERHTVFVKQPVRERLPNKRRSTTTKFRVADCEGYFTVG
ncbi:MAG: hypothetical protein H0U92_13420, partial [Actinobacteria bacterium]|nr:hypothetical protein [Actinomycetota bacterium]